MVYNLHDDGSNTVCIHKWVHIVTDEDIHRSGYTRAELIEECTMSMYLSDNPQVRNLAGTILHLLDEFPWDDDRFKWFTEGENVEDLSF